MIIMDDLAGGLQTARLVLRPLTVADADAMVEVLADERMYEFTGGEPRTLEQLRERYRRLSVGHSPDGTQRWLNWIVCRLDDDAPVGVVQATVLENDSIADVAWEIGTAWQGLGYASEAATAMINWLVDQGVRTIDAYIHPAHTASMRVAERAGLERTDEVVDSEYRWRRSRG